MVQAWGFTGKLFHHAWIKNWRIPHLHVALCLRIRHWIETCQCIFLSNFSNKKETVDGKLAKRFTESTIMFKKSLSWMIWSSLFVPFIHLYTRKIVIVTIFFQSLGLTHVLGAFLVWGCGIFVSSITLFLEIRLSKRPSLTDDFEWVDSLQQCNFS